MINDLPTVYEVVSGTDKIQSKEKSTVSNHSSNKSKSGSKGVKFKFVSQVSLVIFNQFGLTDIVEY